MDNNKFDYLLPEITSNLTTDFLTILSNHPAFKEEIDTSPLLNLTVGVFIGSLINILNIIKKNTNGEEELFKNIELTKNALIKVIKDLSFVKKVEFI